MKQTYTASFHNGGRKKSKNGNDVRNPWQACRLHNIRDPEYTKKQRHIKQDGKEGIDYEIWTDWTWEDAYTELFSNAIDKYNSEQKRKDRKIKDAKEYLEKMKNHKTKVPVYESIVSIGNAKNKPENQKLVKTIYKEFVDNWKKKYPNLVIIGAYYHADESREKGIQFDTEGGRINGVPHLHIDWVPVEFNRKESFEKGNRLNDEGEKTKYLRGMDVENNLNGAFAQMNIFSKELSPKIAAKNGLYRNERKFKDEEMQENYNQFLASRDTDTREYYAVMFWEKQQRDTLIKLCEHHGLIIENPNEHTEHVDTADYAQAASVRDSIVYNKQLTIDLENERSNYEINNMKIENEKSNLAEKAKEAARLIKLEQEKVLKLNQKLIEVRNNTDLLESIRDETKRLNDLRIDTNWQLRQAQKQIEQKLQQKIDETKRVSEEAQKKLQNANAYLDEERNKLRKSEEERINQLKEREKIIEESENKILQNAWDKFDKTTIPEAENANIELPSPRFMTAERMYGEARIVIAKVRQFFTDKIKSLNNVISELKDKIVSLQKDHDELIELKKPFHKEWPLKDGTGVKLSFPFGGREAMNAMADMIYEWETDTPENNLEKTKLHQIDRKRNMTQEMSR